MGTRAVEVRGSLVADLPRGRIESRDKQRLVAMPAEWIVALVKRANLGPADRAELGALLASALVADVKRVLDEDESSPEDMAYALSMALATRGLGTVEFERWGDALTLLWHDLPEEGNEAWGDIGAAAGAAVVRSLTGLAVEGAPVGWSHGSLRVLLASKAVCAIAREKTKAGESLLAVLGTLEAPSKGEAGRA